MEIVNTTGVTVERDTAPEGFTKGLRIQPDQRSEWIDCQRRELSLAQAIDAVNRVAETDGRRVDVPGIALDACKADIDPDTGALALFRKGYLTLREHAYKQVCSAIGAPAPYLRTLPESTALDCLNHGLRTRGNQVRKFRVADRRQVGGGLQARAVVSDRFAPLDDRLVLPILAEAVERFTQNAVVTQLAVGDVTVLRVTIGELDMPDGHPIRYGFDLRNGELGNASIALCASIYRLVCTNGMRAMTRAQQTRWRHVGDVERLRDAFAETLPETIQQTHQVAQICAEATDRVMSLEEIRGYFRKLDMSKAQQAEAERLALVEAGYFKDGGEPPQLPADTTITLWNAINGVTASARPLAHQGRLHVEEQAGILLAAA